MVSSAVLWNLSKRSGLYFKSERTACWKGLKPSKPSRRQNRSTEVVLVSASWARLSRVKKAISFMWPSTKAATCRSVRVMFSSSWRIRSTIRMCFHSFTCKEYDKTRGKSIVLFTTIHFLFLQFSRAIDIDLQGYYNFFEKVKTTKTERNFYYG